MKNLIYLIVGIALLGCEASISPPPSCNSSSGVSICFDGMALNVDNLKWGYSGVSDFTIDATASYPGQSNVSIKFMFFINSLDTLPLVDNYLAKDDGFWGGSGYSWFKTDEIIYGGGTYEMDTSKINTLQITNYNVTNKTITAEYDGWIVNKYQLMNVGNYSMHLNLNNVDFEP